MALAENPKLHDLVNAMQQSFTPIHTDWVKETAPVSSGAATDILRDDILALGLFISAHDAVGAKIEKQLLVELVSFLTPSLGQMPYEYTLGTLDQQIAQLPAPDAAQEWPAIKSLDIAKTWAATGSNRAVKAQQLVALFSDLANQFVLRDGRVSDAEIAFLNAFDKHFAIA